MEYQIERTTPEKVGIPSVAILRFIDRLEDEAFTDIHSIMISRYGKVCAEGWWQPYAPGIPHAIWSLSKTYTATAVGVAVKEGILGLDERLGDIFPELSPKEPDRRFAGLTVRNLLKMSSGIADEVFGNTEDWLEVFLHSEFAYEPGEAFSYVSQGTNALGVAVSRRSHMTMEQYLQEKVFAKIGICSENTRWMRLPDGSELAAGGLHATTEDNLRLMLMYMQGGAWNGEQILDEEYIRLATTKQVENKIRYDHMPGAAKKTKDNTAGYGYQLWMLSHPGAYAGQGAQGQYGVVFPNEQIVISTTQILNPTYPDGGHLYDLMFDLVKEVSDHPFCEDPEGERKLRNRLKRLSIPSPDFSPYSDFERETEGVRYETKEGKFTVYPVFEGREHMGTGRMVTAGIDSFYFRFTPDRRRCHMSFTEDGLDRELEIALDGTRCFNILKNPNQVPREVLLSGFWESEKVLVLKARWVETTIEKTIWFRFDEDRVTVEAKLTVGTMGAFSRDGENAVAVRMR